MFVKKYIYITVNSAEKMLVCVVLFGATPVGQGSAFFLRIHFGVVAFTTILLSTDTNMFLDKPVDYNEELKRPTVS
jgi:hypothetical protein